MPGAALRMVLTVAESVVPLVPQRGNQCACGGPILFAGAKQPLDRLSAVYPFALELGDSQPCHAGPDGVWNVRRAARPGGDPNDRFPALNSQTRKTATGSKSAERAARKQSLEGLTRLWPVEIRRSTSRVSALRRVRWPNDRRTRQADIAMAGLPATSKPRATLHCPKDFFRPAMRRRPLIWRWINWQESVRLAPPPRGQTTPRAGPAATAPAR